MPMPLPGPPGVDTAVLSSRNPILRQIHGAQTMSKRLQGKTAFITAAGQGIGRAIA